MTELQIDIHRSLIEKCRKGSEKARFELYNLYSKAMFSTALRLLNNRHDAEDVLQDAFTEAFRNLSGFRFESTFGAWLKQIVINRCINMINKRHPDIEYFEDLPDNNVEECEWEPDANTDPEATVKIIRKAMEQLPEGSRTIFSLYLLEGYDHTEISQILNISESTSKSQFMRAKMKIKEILIQGKYEFKL